MTTSPKTFSSSLRPLGVCAALLGLTACATEMPAGPTLVAVPHPGEDYATFRQHDDYCQTTARADVGTSPGAVANSHAVGSALVGAGVGAAAGALLGSAGGAAGPGAAIGAGTGLLFGGALGANGGDAAAIRIQRRYNVVYAQCMTAYGERVRGGGGYGSYPPPYPGYPPPPPGYARPY